MHHTRNSSLPGGNSQIICIKSAEGIKMTQLLFELKESLHRTVKASASILATGHIGKMQTIVTGEIQHVNGNQLSICCMEQL